MGLMQSLLALPGRLLRSMENPRRPLDPWSNALGESLDGSLSAAGIRVSREKALTYAAWWRGVSLLCGTVAKLPLGVYRRTGPGAEPEPTHPAYRLLRRQPNEAMTAFVWKHTMQAHVIQHGNGYSYIYRRADGTPIELLPLDPERTYPVRENRTLWYVHELKTGGEARKLPAEDVLHIKGLSFDGLEGYSLLSKARESLGLGLAMSQFASTFFRNSARPNVVLTHPGRLSPEARKNLRESWERMHAGLDNAHRTAILEEGVAASELSINARDSQLLESRSFSLIEIANWLGLPPHKLGASVNVSYKSLEQENQSYLDDAIDPWLVRWEEECESKLLGTYQRDRETHTIAFDRFPLVRADLQQRGTYYVQALSNGWMCADDVRAREGLNPLPDGLGSIYYRPVNLAAVNADPDGVDGPAVAPGSTLLDVPDVRQADDYDCGPAAVQAACSLFGMNPSRADLIQALGTNERQGTRPSAILDYLSRQGLVTTAAGQLEVVDLTRFFSWGQPVLCPVQVADDGETVGHWVVVTRTGLGQVFLQDPATGPRMVAEADWLARWRDRDADGVSYERYGIAIGEALPAMAGPASGEGEAAGGPSDPEPSPDPAVDDTGDDRAERVRGPLHYLLGETLGRMVRRIGMAARRAAQKPSGFGKWLDTLEAEHSGVMGYVLAPVLQALGALDGRTLAADGVAAELVDELRTMLLEASEVPAAELGQSIGELMERLEADPASLNVCKALVGE